MISKFSDDKLMRRVAGYHDIRLDGVSDVVLRAKGKSVLDIGCNRGLVGFEFANNGAARVDGCDNYEDGIIFARHLFCDLRNCENQWEVTDLTKGPAALKAFGDRSWDIVVFLATYHKLRRIMQPNDLTALVRWFGSRTKEYFVWRGTDKRDENDAELRDLDRDLGAEKLNRIHTSYISKQLGASAIWERVV